MDSRFWDKVDVRGADECWEWKAGKLRSGYGCFRAKGRALRAHRFSWEEANGPIPIGLHVCHRCDNPACCNPAHLFLGTQGENVQDCLDKGRKPKGSAQANAKLTEEQAIGAMARLLTGRECHREVAESYGVATTTVSNIWIGITWMHLFDGGYE